MSRGGRSTKIHAAVDALGNPIAILLTTGNTPDITVAEKLISQIDFNLILTDPPYNVAYESADGKSIQNDNMEDSKFHAFLFAAFQNRVPHLAEGASAYIFHADTEGLNFRTAFQEAGFAIAGVCIWMKNSVVLGRSPYTIN